jgi:hypothetical protein
MLSHHQVHLDPSHHLIIDLLHLHHHPHLQPQAFWGQVLGVEQGILVFEQVIY